MRSKQDALAELTVLLADARALLARPLTTSYELQTAHASRATWQLKVKKTLHELLGDHAGLVRLMPPAVDDQRPLLGLADEARAFQETVLAQVMILDKVSLLLRQLA